ncbi:MAG: nucleotidyl transferase AbiEii/AbiGii toxin family protein [Deltaproteobacteria bacterium]|nr:nucleotidyl transferase AbiEii/AbiGii toxin family protein [Deltaproteobacteria bacterium]
MRELRFFWDYMSEQVDHLRRVLQLLRRRRVRHALVGGHAVSFHWKPRLTVDIDFLVPARALAGLQRALPEHGFAGQRRGEVLRVWNSGADPAVADSVVDFVPAEYNRTQQEALRTALDAVYQDLPVRVVTRPALVALKFLSATSAARAVADKHQDLADLAHLVQQAWSPADAREARRLVELSYPGGGHDLDRLIGDVRAGRPITV